MVSELQIIDFPKLLLKCGLVKSKAEAKRWIKQGAVEIDGVKVGPLTIVVYDRRRQAGS